MTRSEEFEELRPLLFAIAYRLLGSVSDAEDAVQETWLRFQASSTEARSAKAFLSAVVTRVSIDVLKSARRQREEYVGTWFPEPLIDDPYQSPERSAEIADSVSMAALVLLERLSPLERAVFVLREIFAFGFADISGVVGRSEEACRQLAARARRHMDQGVPRFEADRKARDELATTFLEAFRDGDVAALKRLLSADVQLVGDGGGKAPLFGERIVGAENVARLLTALVPAYLRTGGVIEAKEVNGQPGALLKDAEGRVICTWALDIVDGQIQMIRSVMNPDKLHHLGPVGDAFAALAQARRAQRSAGTDEDAADGGETESH